MFSMRARSSFLTSFVFALAAFAPACAAPSEGGDEELANATEDITSTQSFKNVCATSANSWSRSGPVTGDAAGVLYVARCPTSGPGRILRVDFKANTSVEIATFDAKATTVWFEDVGADFALWRVMKEKPNDMTARIERKVGLWDASLPAPLSVDPRAVFPRNYEDPRAEWVDFLAYAGQGRVVASWEWAYKTRQLGVVSLATSSAVWSAPERIASARTDLRVARDRKHFLVTTDRGPYDLAVGANVTARALDQRLLGGSLPYDASGNYPPLDPKRALMQSSTDFGRFTWSSVDLATGVRTDLGTTTTYASAGVGRVALAASDGTPAALVAASGPAGPAGVEVRVVRADGSVAAGALPAGASRILYVAPKGAFVVAEEVLRVPGTSPWEKVEHAKLWLTRPGSNQPASALFGGAEVGPAAHQGLVQELPTGVNLFVWRLERKWNLLELDAQGAEKKSFEVPGTSIIPLQPGRALVDMCVVDLSGAAPASTPNGCLEGSPRGYPWAPKSGARVLAFIPGPEVRVFRY